MAVAVSLVLGEADGEAMVVDSPAELDAGALDDVPPQAARLRTAAAAIPRTVKFLRWVFIICFLLELCGPRLVSALFLHPVGGGFHGDIRNTAESGLEKYQKLFAAAL
jgi:hypothetical protein